MVLLDSNNWQANLRKWFVRAADPKDRPLSPMLLIGHVGSGKTSGVREVAEETGVYLIELGSDSTEALKMSIKEQTPCTTRASMRLWIEYCSCKTLIPQVLFFDDGEAIVMNAGSDVATRVTHKDYLKLASGNTPVLIACSDTGATKILGDLAKCSDVLKERVGKIYPALLVKFLREKYPKAPYDRCVAIANHVNGDVRQACLELEYGNIVEESFGEVQVTQSHSIFDHVNAVLGIEHFVPETNTEAILERHNFLTLHVTPKILSTLPPETTIDTVADITCAYAAFDSLASIRGMYAEIDPNRYDYKWYGEAVLLPSWIRTLQGRTRPKKISFTGPVGGTAAKRALRARGLGGKINNLRLAHEFLDAKQECVESGSVPKRITDAFTVNVTMEATYDARIRGHTRMATLESIAKKIPLGEAQREELEKVKHLLAKAILSGEDVVALLQTALPKKNTPWEKPKPLLVQKTKDIASTQSTQKAKKRRTVW